MPPSKSTRKSPSSSSKKRSRVDSSEEPRAKPQLTTVELSDSEEERPTKKKRSNDPFSLSSQEEPVRTSPRRQKTVREPVVQHQEPVREPTNAREPVRPQQSRQVGRDPHAIKIMISTDNHLGYLEKDPVRGNDSFQAFEEVLQLAQDHKCDMILLGGDLFHDNKPSRNTLYNAMRLLRHYCMGDDPVALHLLCDPTTVFHDREVSNVNYMEPTHNISIPVFSIHGNHDDPTGEGNFAALDLLSVAGLVNYFGKWSDWESVKVFPILLRKGDTHLAIYGLGNMRDERLHRLWLKQGVTFPRPITNQDEFLNLFVLHQNRVAHSAKNHIPESMIPNFMDLVIWGHEHQSKPNATKSLTNDLEITQPGSTIATSLSEGESDSKHCCILTIKGKDYDLKPIALRTVRPFIMDNITLKDLNLDKKNMNAVKAAVEAKVNEMIHHAKERWIRLNPDVDESLCPIPLIRLKVDYTDYENFARQSFGGNYVKKVANSREILQLYRKRKIVRREKTAGPSLPDEVDTNSMEDYVMSILQDKKLKMLPETEMTDALKAFVDKGDTTAIDQFVKESLQRTRDHVLSRRPAPAPVDEEDEPHYEVMQHLDIKRLDQLIEQEKQRAVQDYQHHPEKNRYLSATVNREATPPDRSASASADEDERPKIGKGSRGGRGGKAKATGTTRKAATKKSEVISEVVATTVSRGNKVLSTETPSDPIPEAPLVAAPPRAPPRPTQTNVPPTNPFFQRRAPSSISSTPQASTPASSQVINLDSDDSPKPAQKTRRIPGYFAK